MCRQPFQLLTHYWIQHGIRYCIQYGIRYCIQYCLQHGIQNRNQYRIQYRRIAAAVAPSGSSPAFSA
jgi:hypothetical protein